MTTETKKARLNELQGELKNITDELLGDENISDSRDKYLRSLRTNIRREMETLKAEIATNDDAIDTVKFEVGKTYYAADFAGEWSEDAPVIVKTLNVIKRTAKTLTAINENGEQVLKRINLAYAGTKEAVAVSGANDLTVQSVHIYSDKEYTPAIAAAPTAHFNAWIEAITNAKTKTRDHSNDAKPVWEDPHNYETVGANHPRNLYSNDEPTNLEETVEPVSLTPAQNLAAEIVNNLGNVVVKFAYAGEGKNGGLALHYETFNNPNDEFPTDTTIVEVFAPESYILDHVNVIKGYGDDKQIVQHLFKDYYTAAPAPDKTDERLDVTEIAPPVDDDQDGWVDVVEEPYKFTEQDCRDLERSIGIICQDRIDAINAKAPKGWAVNFKVNETLSDDRTDYTIGKRYWVTFKGNFYAEIQNVTCDDMKHAEKFWAKYTPEPESPLDPVDGTEITTAFESDYGYRNYQIGDETVKFFYGESLTPTSMLITAPQYGATFYRAPASNVEFHIRPTRSDNGYIGEEQALDADEFFKVMAERGACTIDAQPPTAPKPGSPFAIANGLTDILQNATRGIDYMDVTTQGGAKTVTNFGAAYIEPDWRSDSGYVFGNHYDDVLARYETPEQVIDVMTALRDAIKAGKTEFAFPPVEESPTEPKVVFDRVLKARQHGISHVTTKQGRHMWYIYGRLVNKKEITEWLADEGFTVDEYIAAEKIADKYADEVEFPRRMAVHNQAEFLWDKITADRKASVETLPALFPADDSDDADELIDPPADPVISKEHLGDSLTRAMKIALEYYKGFCRAGKLTAAENELTLYNICRKATLELRKE